MEWKQEKPKLIELIETGLSYEKIGRIYNCSGSNIRRVCKRLGIILEKRREINTSEHFNKGRGRKKYCQSCGKLLNSHQNKFCSCKCMGKFRNDKSVQKWLDGNYKSKSIIVPHYIRNYLIKLHDNKCEYCGWCEINPNTGLVPLEVHHIDGDYTNNNPENLQLLCPNCHSLTETYKNSNKLGRSKRLRIPQD